MPAVDVLDDTFVRAAPGVVLAATAGRWSGWLPDLDLVVREDRGLKGMRWDAVSRASSGSSAPLQGTAEVWLEPVGAGTVVHLYVRLDPVTGSSPGPSPRGATGWRARDLPDHLRREWKRGLHRRKDELEGETWA